MSETKTEPTEPQEPAGAPDEPEAEPEPSEQPAEPQEPAEAPEAPAEPEQPAESQDPAAPAAPSTMSVEKAEKTSSAAYTDWQRFRQRTVDRWEGEGEYLRDCPLCLDQHKGLVDLRHAGNYPREIASAVMGFLGLAREQDYKQSGKHQSCLFCDGNGKVSTGSHVAEFVTVPCPECKGFGYTPPPAATGNVVAIGSAAGAFEPPPSDDIEHGDADNWGEPRILPDGRPNPNYGKQPAFKVLVDPYGVTANLTTLNAGNG